jgi:cell division protein FtsA
MSKKNYDIYFDLGSSKIRAAAFSQNEKTEKTSLEKDNICSLKIKKFNFLDTSKNIETMIYQLEEKIDLYMNTINLMIDTSDALSISLSLSKKSDGKKIEKKDIQYLIQNAKQQILKFYPGKKIIHIIVSNYKVDGIDYEYFPTNIDYKFLSIDIFFICYPKKLIKNLEDLFRKHQISINQFLCSSYSKSLNYKEQFVNFEKVAFIDIGYEKTSIIIYDNEKLKAFNVIPIGGNHITKDISKVLNFSIEESELIKKNLNNDILFSEDDQDSEEFKINFLDKSKDKKVSLSLIKKIIFSRIDEILNLSLDTIKFYEDSNEINKLKVVLTGDGSKILNNNYIKIKETLPLFEQIDFFSETPTKICESGLKLHQGLNKQEVVIVPKKIQTSGFFERLFHFFK